MYKLEEGFWLKMGKGIRRRDVLMVDDESNTNEI